MNIKNIIAIGSFLLLYLNGLSQHQGDSDSVGYYTKNLSWSSIRLTPTYVPFLMLSYDAQFIVHNITDTVKTVALLLKEIEKEEKAVTVHVILSKLYEPQNNSFRESYVYKADSIVAVNYFYNTLTWRFDSETGKYSIKPEEIKKIKAYWEKKLPVLQNMSKSARRKQTKKCNKALKRGL